MPRRSHGELVADQFGTRAQAYLTSPVHAQGADLDQLEDLVRGHAGARVLDMGCGGGHVGFHAAPHVAEVVAFDLSGDMLEVVAAEATRRGLTSIRTMQGAVERMPFADGEFDFVFSRYSAHHWRNLQAGLREARRVLKTGGTGAFVDLVSPDAALFDTFLQTIELMRDPSHVRDYSISEWSKELEAVGFSVTGCTVRRVGIDFASWIQRMGTPTVRTQAILSLQREIPAEVVERFEIEPSGSFVLDCASFEALAPAI